MHQDFDIYGDTIEEVTDAYLADTRGVNAAGFVEEIESLLAEADDEQVRANSFDRSLVAIRPEGWGLTAREWLGVVREHVAAVLALRTAEPPSVATKAS